MRNRLLLASLGVLALTQTAQAQRPVITQNTDEPGRVPYQSYRLAPCSAFADLSFDAVPAGKRLVLTFASGYFTGQPGIESVEVQTRSAGGTAFVSRVFLPFTVVGSAFGGRQFAAPIEVYVEAGVSPSISVLGCTGDGHDAYGTLAGYLVSVP